MTLRVDFEKRTDGDVIMRCTRADGTTLWQRHAGARAVFFAYHDLTHLAVERALGITHGFFGLIASGWEIADTEGRGTRGPVPESAVTVENLVGLFDRERAGGSNWTATEFNEAARMYAEMHGHAAPPTLTDDEITRARDEVASLHTAWRDTQPGAVLRVDFDA